MNDRFGGEPDPPAEYSCESCGRPLPSEQAFAPMETLDVWCSSCLREVLKPCDECGTLIRASAYQHLPTGVVVCEACVLKKLPSPR